MADNILELLAEGITIRDDLIRKMNENNANLRREIQELTNFNLLLRSQLDQQNLQEKELLAYRQEIEILHLKNYELLLKLQASQGPPYGNVPPVYYDFTAIPPTTATIPVDLPPTLSDPKKKAKGKKKKDGASASENKE